MFHFVAATTVAFQMLSTMDVSVPETIGTQTNICAEVANIGGLECAVTLTITVSDGTAVRKCKRVFVSFHLLLFYIRPF